MIPATAAQAETTTAGVKFRLLKSEACPLTRELAIEFRDLEPSLTERDFRPDRLKHLRAKADMGKLVTFQWAKAKLDGRWVRVNGQHSSRMLCELDGAFPRDLWAHIDEYEVDSVDGLVDLFRQFDDRKSARGAGDVAGAFQNTHPELHDIPKPLAKLTAEGVNWYTRTITKDYTPSGDDQYQIFSDTNVQRFARWLKGVLNSKSRELQKRTVIAAMYATFIASERGAGVFWDDVARGGKEYDENAPATRLDDYLRKIQERELDKQPPGNYYQASVYCWNAFCAERPLTTLKFPDVKKGWLTPYAG